MNFNTLAKQIYEDNKAKGFWDRERNVGEMLMLVTSELGEAMESHRKDKFSNIRQYNAGFRSVLSSNTKTKENAFKEEFEEHIKDTFEDEIADSIIRLLDMAGGLNIDLDFHITNKLAYNRTREKLHGKKY